MKTILSIAGSDPSGGAGIQADIRAITACGGYPAAVPTALTVQNTLGVSEVCCVDADLVRKQIAAVLQDLQPAAIKIGMVGSCETVVVIAELLRKYLQEHPSTAVVLDPVMAATSGKTLMDGSLWQSVEELLLPLVTLITPNIPEARQLLQDYHNDATDAAAMLSMAGEISRKYGVATLLKGGHLEGDTMTDVLFCNDKTKIYEQQKIESRNLHGTGCMLSSAVATFLAKGYAISEAVGAAKQFLTSAIKAAQSINIGHGNGPLITNGGIDLIGITQENFFEGEAEAIMRLLDGDVSRVHIRKPSATADEVEALIRGIRPVYYDRLTIHNHLELQPKMKLGGVHLNSLHPLLPEYIDRKSTLVSIACHSIKEISERYDEADYLFLSPIFDSISKQGYGAKYSLQELMEAHESGIINKKIVAMGGITPDRIATIKALGFGGAALLGALWEEV
ncbi:MAG: bifunctional hydroxymethylpyrimidine kinase/phosphomethylpyrimidine kinase [Bacteroidaceae bacterium]|nr:bifunctional hydroxymethylpyrimidine kinase/phosphomethylpyrimidine kinase [Bacteroidaceae bacterium]